MSETTAPDPAAPGVRALQAGFEQGAGQAAQNARLRTERDEVRQENQQLWAAVLGLLTRPMRETLVRMAAAEPDSFCWPYLYATDWYTAKRAGLIVGDSMIRCRIDTTARDRAGRGMRERWMIF